MILARADRAVSVAVVLSAPRAWHGIYARPGGRLHQNLHAASPNEESRSSFRWGNVNRDPGSAILHQRRRAARFPRDRAPVMARESRVAAADSEANRAARPISYQGEEDAIRAQLCRLFLQTLDRFRFALRCAVEETGAARRIQDRDFLIMPRRHMINFHLGRADRWSGRRDESRRTARATGQETSEDEDNT